MEREVYDQLLKWKNSPYRKPLVLNGARQVGKTWILKEFGRREYKNKALPYLQSIPKNRLIYPGHGEPFIMGDSKYI